MIQEQNIFFKANDDSLTIVYTLSKHLYKIIKNWEKINYNVSSLIH